MTKLGIVIDSTTVLESTLIKKYNIQIASLEVSVNGVSTKEVEMTDQYIIEKISDKNNKIKTSAANPHDFKVIYQKLREQGYQDILVVPLSKGLSSTYHSANIAKESMSDSQRIYVIDTNVCNYGNANLIETILPMVDQDQPVDEIVKAIQERSENTNLLFTVYSLRHLYNGGRLSLIGVLLGTLLKFKPVIEMQDGKLEMIDKARTDRKVLEIFMKHIRNYTEKFKYNFLKIVNLNNDANCELLIKKVKEAWDNVVITVTTKINPVFHTHLGNSGIGITISSFN